MNRVLHYFSEALTHRLEQRKWLEEHQFLVGDLHNHCNISYGHGDLEDAIAFAAEQLDFFSVTGHFAWPDMEEGTIPPEVQAYHREGFARLRTQWSHYNQLLERASERCISFPSYEFHSFQAGDYTIIHKNLGIALPDPPSRFKKDERLMKLLDSTDASKDELFCMPHHIGYKQGYRGIGWEFFHAQASPVIEIVSMHGSAESLEASPKYLHTMGPRSGMNTMQGGLSLGHRFGVVGSSDHHNASPGSYGCGRTGLWSTDRNREAIWAGLSSRQTLALTGDPIELMVFLNDNPMGSGYDFPGDGIVSLDAYVAGYTVMDRIEILKNNRVIHRVHPSDNQHTQHMERGFLDVTFGWGEKHSLCQWEAAITIEKGIIRSASPRLRGEDIVDPLDNSDNERIIPHFTSTRNTASLTVVTRGNPTATTDATQGFALEIEGSEQSVVHIHAKGFWHEELHYLEASYLLSSLSCTSRVAYLNGFVSPAVSISQFHPIEQCIGEVHTEVNAQPGDFFYARAFTNNGDCAWSSPCWVR
jgi:hypothetical protein